MLAINPSVLIPGPIAKLISKLLENQVNDLLNDLSDEVERQVLLQQSCEE